MMASHEVFDWHSKSGNVEFHTGKRGAPSQEGCNVLEKIYDSEYGKFGWVIDPEGNKVELWQPPEG